MDYGGFTVYIAKDEDEEVSCMFVLKIISHSWYINTAKSALTSRSRDHSQR